MVKKGYSSSESRGFESEHHVLDGHFFTLICCKNSIDVWPNINEKVSGDGPFLKIIACGYLVVLVVQRFSCLMTV